MTQSSVRDPEQPNRVSDVVGVAAVTAKAGLISRGFRGFATVQDLVDRGVPPDLGLRQCGVYAVVAPPGYEPAFILPGAARERGNVLRPWPVDRLRSKWVPWAETVYIGIAGARSPRTLADRLRELARHASGRTSRNGPHKVGEIPARGLRGVRGRAPSDGRPSRAQGIGKGTPARIQARNGEVPVRQPEVLGCRGGPRLAFRQKGAGAD